MEKCILCGKPNTEKTRNASSNTTTYECDNCGIFYFYDFAKYKVEDEHLKLASIIKKFRIDGNTKNIGITATEYGDFDDEYTIEYSVEELLRFYPRTFEEKVDLILNNLSKLSKFEGDTIELDKYETNSVLYISDNDENCINYLLKTLQDLKYIEHTFFQINEYTTPNTFTLEPEGWKRIYNNTNMENTNKVFVAMWFDSKLNSAYEKGICKAITDNGYEPIRIDKAEHNNKICDEIIGAIRKAKFVICDFTGQRGGVYFEAGFAMGLNKQVIWCCKEEALKELHFDTRQYNHIIWKDEKELYENLDNRIKATII